MKSRQWCVLRFLLLSIICVLVIAIGAFALWWRTLPASQAALDALHSGQGISVTTTADQIAFLPSSSAKVGLIFYPGARVDPAAYALYMRTFAEHGYAAFILKEPLNFALLNENQAANVIAAHPAIKTWVIGGHSLGGVAACRFVAKTSSVRGLLLYGSYSDVDLSRQTSLAVVSIYGTNDALATPAKIEAAKGLLPPGTQYLAIQGGIHSFFGEYGLQDGDGKPAISREEARSKIIAASLDLLNKVTGISIFVLPQRR